MNDKKEDVLLRRPIPRSATCNPPRLSMPSVSVASGPRSSDGRLSGWPTAAATAFVIGQRCSVVYL